MQNGHQRLLLNSLFVPCTVQSGSLTLSSASVLSYVNLGSFCMYRTVYIVQNAWLTVEIGAQVHFRMDYFFTAKPSNRAHRKAFSQHHINIGCSNASHIQHALSVSPLVFLFCARLVYLGWLVRLWLRVSLVGRPAWRLSTSAAASALACTRAWVPSTCST